MLRRTAARAFAGVDAAEPGAGAFPELLSVRWARSVDRLFDDLREELEAGLERARGKRETACSKPPPAGGEKAGEGAGAPAEEPAPVFRISRPRPILQGIEFVLEGPRGAVRCVHTLRGFLQVSISVDGESARQELLSCQRQGGEYRPICKALAGTCGERGGLAVEGTGSRVAFFFTSAGELARMYLARVGLQASASTAKAAGSIPDVDTFLTVP